MALKSSNVRFAVDLDRKVDADFERIARDVEKRPKVDFHRRLCVRLVTMFNEDPSKLFELGLVRKGE